MGSIRLFDISEDRGPFDPSWIVSWDHRLAIPTDPDKRISELSVLLEDDRYENQRVNLQAAISMYQQHILLDSVKRLVHIQDGKVVRSSGRSRSHWDTILDRGIRTFYIISGQLYSIYIINLLQGYGLQI